MDQASRIAFYLLLLAALILIGWSTRERKARRMSGVPADLRRRNHGAVAPGAARETRNPSRIFPAGSVRRVG